MKLDVNDLLQWCGTMCFMGMYTLMAINEYPWNIVAGLFGSTCYLIWCIRVANKPQMIVNSVGIVVCLAGILKAVLYDTKIHFC